MKNIEKNEIKQKSIEEKTDDLKQCIGNRIRNLRVELNYSQEKLADITNISKSAIGYYETGKRIPQGEELARLSLAFNVPITYLLCDTNTKEKTNIEISNEIGLSDKAINNLRRMKNSKFKTRESYAYYAIEKMLEDIDNVDDWGIERLLPEIGIFLLQPTIENNYLSNEAKEYMKKYSDEFNKDQKVKFLNIYELLKRIHNETSKSEQARDCFIDMYEDVLKKEMFED